MHFGSLVAAVGSYADARAHGGEWLVRMEDLDRAREVPGAADDILRTLDAFGFEWDGAILYQSRRHDAYAEAIERLRGHGLIYPCGCSRAEIARAGWLGAEGPVYPGTCRTGLASGRRPRALRIHTGDTSIGYRDRVLGDIEQDLAREVGDFVLRRADGIHAYQLAVVVDDAEQGVTQIVRGADLVRSTPRQIYLQQSLGLATPAYAHLPLAVDQAGRKLSKSSAATPVERADPIPALLRAWAFLGQSPLPERAAHPDELWSLAVPLWDLARTPATLALPIHARSRAR
ncbi:MAG: tRNA glutamyl-Q(34) synthetase GluQRS [Chromatiaceae bacterium]|nr:tRNA glutamyl-Q(34) synthetase GluQRS [Chromatiaceae bacterium]